MTDNLVNILAGAFLPQKQKVVGAAVVAVCIVVLLITAYIAAIIGSWFALAPIYGVAAASLIIATAAVALVPLILAAGWVLKSIRQRQALKEAQHQGLPPEAQIAQLAATALPLLVRKNPVATVGIIAGLSYLITRSQRS